MARYKILRGKGPSIEDILLAVRLRHERRDVTFTLAALNVPRDEFSIKVLVETVTALDESGYSWKLVLLFPGFPPRGMKSRLEVEYNSLSREGSVIEIMNTKNESITDIQFGDRIFFDVHADSYYVVRDKEIFKFMDDRPKSSGSLNEDGGLIFLSHIASKRGLRVSINTMHGYLIHS